MGVDFSQVQMPFNVGDLLSSSMAFLGLFGGFILLALAISFAPQIMWLIRTTIVTEQNRRTHNREYGDTGRWTKRDSAKLIYDKVQYRRGKY